MVFFIRCREYYEKAKTHLINPVQKVVTITDYEPIQIMWGAGETALSQLSQLNPPKVEEFAIYKGEEVVDQFEVVDARYTERARIFRVQLWKYNPCYFAREGHVDPVSLACTFKDNQDERIEMCIEKMLEEI